MSEDDGVLDITDIRRRMEGALNALSAEFSGLRTGRASAALLESVMVEAYGQHTPLSQVASISVPEARLLSLQVWDKTMVQAVEKGILNADLGLNPVVDGQTLRLPIPPLNEERRGELAKKAGQYAEQGRIAIRNVRRDSMERLKRLEKSGNLGEDESRSLAENVQKLTDEMIKRVDETLKTKQDDIMQV